jgi:hypothetical protein
VQLDQGDAFLDDPLHRSLGLVAEYPQADWGKLTQVGAFWQLGDLQAPLRLAPPSLGEHSVAVLGEVGLEAAAIDRLLDEKVVVQWAGIAAAGTATTTATATAAAAATTTTATTAAGGGR